MTTPTTGPTTGWPPRPAGAHGRPSTSTQSDSAPCTAEFPSAASSPQNPAEGVTNSAIDVESAITQSDDEAVGGGLLNAAVGLLDLATWRRIAGWFGHEFRPPLVWTERPASLSDLSAYAWSGGWTGLGGPARIAGVWWYRLVGIPLSTVAYYAAWLAQRPSRFFVALFLYTLLAQTSVGRAVLPWPHFGWLTWPF